eukprot:CAMPEP_0180414798 /NCGR_PEP_ID=MMETSP0989-20121125/45847_1 /TAXON_ID=697907 /ORGANISM="non described non described, Strain CCMP2293" /LENGTH=62 /DNA_ID=CAMNT_0022419517 /DNA_START=12 /DNA_END=197 /DNA_ORIENTATION=-
MPTSVASGGSFFLRGCFAFGRAGEPSSSASPSFSTSIFASVSSVASLFFCTRFFFGGGAGSP